MIESVRKLKGLRRVPFGDDLTPLNSAPVRTGLRIQQENIAAASVWTSMIDAVEHRFYVSAIGLVGWKGILGMRECLMRLAKRNCDVKILTMDPENPALPAMNNPTITSAAAESLSQRIASSREWFQETLAGNPRAEVRAIRN